MQKTERFGLVLSPAEKEAAIRLAQGESMAALIRRLIRKAAKDAGMWPPVPGHQLTLTDTRARYDARQEETTHATAA